MGQGDTGFVGGSGGSLAVQGDPTPVPVGSAVLIPGSALYAGVDPTTKALTLDAILAEPPESYCFTVGGSPPSPAALSVWRDAARSGAVYVRKMQAYFRTAQTTADIANYYRLKALGSVSGSALLPFTAVANSFLLNNGYGAELDKGMDSASIGFSMAGGQPAFGYDFTPTQTLTLTGFKITTGLQVIFQGSGASPLPGGAGAIPVRCSICDTAGNILTSTHSPPLNAAVTNNNAITFLFPRSFTAQAGTKYYLMFDILEAFPTLTGVNANAYTVGTGVYTADSGSAHTGGALPSLNTGGAMIQNGSNVWTFQTGGTTQAMVAAYIRSITLKQVITGTGFVSQYGLTRIQLDPLYSTQGSARNWLWQLFGSPSGLAVVTGDITFNVDTVGAPPATGLGTDMTVQALLSLT